MQSCLDIHTHHTAPQPQGVVSLNALEFIGNEASKEFTPLPDQRYSLGIHPWDTTRTILKAQWEEFEALASRPEIVAIGECGIDKVKGGFMYNQVIVMNRQIEISERLGKPMILHDVKAHDIVTSLRRDLNPKQNWAVHGFRYKPTVAKMLTSTGIYLSYGEIFNPASLLATPPEMILAETDESELSIEQIIARLSEYMGKDITSLIEENTERFLSGNKD